MNAFADSCSPWVSRVVSVQGTVEVKRSTQRVWSRVNLHDEFCAGDIIRTEIYSRAGLLLRNETVLRLDQRTTLVLPELDDEDSAWLNLLNGAIHFISNVPYQLKIKTPFVNAAMEGTEFAVRVTESDTKVWVVEGQVLVENTQGKLRLGPGKAALTEAGKAPVPYLKITPRDAVQWALYYPPIIDYRTGTAGDPERQRAVSLYRTGQIPAAIQTLNAIADSARDSGFFTQRAAILLTVGDIQAALGDIDQALALSPHSGAAVALRSIIALTLNDKEQARSLAEKAVELEPKSPTPRVALSFAQQAAFDIEGARESIQKALELSPDDPLAWARLSELELSTGNLDEALEAARKAEALDPGLSHTQMVLGFAQLLQIDVDEAKESFSKAINLDPSAPLPRLGMGLARIREGDVEEGTKDIEVAAVLDPENSLIRSYLGKAYYEEKRGTVASREFGIAKELDPEDPTPWFYDAIHKQTTNRPVEALHDMQKAIELNDNRAVYRSSLLLDDDLAARSASLGRVYNDLGFQQIGLLEGWKSQNVDPSNYSVHRLLADNYSSLPRHQIARVSELLQSQLLQPLNITPVQPQLAESNLLIFSGLGPASSSFNEFNPLFARNRFALQASGIIGSNDTYGDEVVQSGLYDRFSYSLGQYHYQTDGFRPNADLETDIYNVFLQGRLSNSTSLQFEYRKENSEAGDLRQSFVKDYPFNDSRQTLDRDSARLGFNFLFAPNLKLLGNLSYGKLTRNTIDPGFESIVPIMLTAFPNMGIELLLPFVSSELPGGFNSQDELPTQSESWNGELQMIGQWTGINLISGVSYVNQSRFRQFFRSATLSSPLDPNLEANLSSSIPNDIAAIFGTSPDILAQDLVDNVINFIVAERTKPRMAQEHSNENHIVGYAYSIIDPIDRVTLTLGGSVDSIGRASSLGNSSRFNHTYVNPKFGIIWQPFDDTTIRAAWFKTVKRPFVSNQTIEPTQVSGFNQFFDDTDYSRSTRYGFGINQVLSPDFTIGGEVSFRNIMAPRFVFGDSKGIQIFSQDEASHRAYAYWTPTNNLSFGAEYFFEAFDRGPRVDIPLATPSNITTHRVPLSLNYFHGNGLFGNLVANYSDQSVTLRTSNTVDSPQHHSFWNFDATIGYRLPKRYGILRLGIKNILDKRFIFQDTNFNGIGAIEGDLLPPLFVPERILFGQITLAF